MIQAKILQEFWHKRSSPLLTRHCTILALPHGNGLAHADPSLRSAPFLGKMVASTANVHLLNTYVSKTRTSPKHVHLLNTYISKTRTSPKYIHLQASTANVHLSLAKSISHLHRYHQDCCSWRWTAMLVSSSWYHCHNIKEQSYWKSIRIFGKWLL